MANDLNDNRLSSIDLSGLPDPVVQSIKQLVDSVREGMTAPSPQQKMRPPLRGRFANLNMSIPKEEIDKARKEMWASD